MVATTPYILVLTTAPDATVADSLGRTLVHEGLVACATVVPGARSIYRWQGQVRTDEELLVLAKTRSERWADVERRLRELHPYDCPEIVALPVAEGSAAYLRWLDGSLASALDPPKAIATRDPMERSPDDP
jgi:periplasmic divalent cation tolerance protein